MAEEWISFNRAEGKMPAEHSPNAAAEGNHLTRGRPGAIIEARFSPMFRLLFRGLPSLAHAFSQKGGRIQLNGEAPKQACGAGRVPGIDGGDGELVVAWMERSGHVQFHRVAPAFWAAIAVAGFFAIDEQDEAIVRRPSEGGLTDRRPGGDSNLFAEIARARRGRVRRVAFWIPGPGTALERQRQSAAHGRLQFRLRGGGVPGDDQG